MIDDDTITLFPELPVKHSEHMAPFLPMYVNAVPIDVKRVHPMAQMPTKGVPEEEDHIRLPAILDRNKTAHIFNVGYDIYAVPDEDWHNPNSQNSYFDFWPGTSKTFSTGIKVATPPCYGFLFRDRSGMGVKDVTVEAGCLEGTFRGEWKVHLINLSHKPVKVTMEKAIVQAVLTFIIPSVINEVDELPPTKRDVGGFGSSGR
jgi:dUTP pyrophosphatase